MAGGNEVRVRMGLHTGEPSVGGSTYVGLDVHRVARISDAGHGGQVLLSERTYELAGGEAVDLGPQPFKGCRSGADLPGRRRRPAPGLPAARLGPEAAGMLAQASNPGAMRVVVAEDSVLLREGIARSARGRRARGRRAGRQRRRADAEGALVQADVAIVDIRMPPTQTDRGLRAAKGDPRAAPGDHVLVLSQYLEPAYALELLSESAGGSRLPAQGPRRRRPEFVAAVQRVGEGGLGARPVGRLAARRPATGRTTRSTS
jgi:hypothetical protein